MTDKKTLVRQQVDPTYTERKVLCAHVCREHDTVLEMLQRILLNVEAIASCLEKEHSEKGHARNDD